MRKSKSRRQPSFFAPGAVNRFPSSVTIAAPLDTPSTATSHIFIGRARLRYALANAGHNTRSLQAYLGHKIIQHMVRYTELAPTRLKDFWRE